MDFPYYLRGDKDFKKAVHAMAMAMATTWIIWKHRNEVLFDKTTPLVNVVLCEILASVNVWLMTRTDYHLVVSQYILI